jgi:hypothetical protein
MGIDILIYKSRGHVPTDEDLILERDSLKVSLDETIYNLGRILQVLEFFPK